MKVQKKIQEKQFPAEPCFLFPRLCLVLVVLKLSDVTEKRCRILRYVFLCVFALESRI